MSESALSATPGPAEGAPVSPASPAAPSGGQPSGDQPGGAAPGEVDARQESPRKSEKRPNLPGVLLNDPEDPWVRSKRRGPDGRFVSTDPGQDEEIRQAEADEAAEGAPGEAPKAPEKAALPPGVEAPKPQGFRFAGQQFESQAAAEQNHRSMQGMFRGLKDGKAAAEARASELDTAYRAWKADAEAARAELARLQSGNAGGGQAPAAGRDGGGQGQPGQGAGAAGEPTSDDLLDGINFDHFEALGVQAGLPAAGKYLTQSILKNVMEKIVPAIRAEFGQTMRPFEEAHTQFAQATAVSQVVEQIGALQIPGGGAAFPELTQGPEVLHAIGKAAREVGLDPAYAMTPRGLMAAIAVYRMSRGLSPQQPAAPAAVVAPIHAPAVAPSAAASIGADGGAGGARRTSPDTRSPEHKRLVAALDEVNFVDRKLGFSRNRPERGV